MKTTRFTTRCLAAIALAAVLPAATAVAANHGPAKQQSPIERGEYLVQIASCNDCHTPGYSRSGGHAAREQLLTGEGEVFAGPWGASYPINLRLFVQSLTAEQWIHAMRTSTARPPMPWYALRAMTDEDLAAVYYYIRSLGPAGKPAHAALPPGQLPAPPYMQVVLPVKAHGNAKK
ncbi:MAG TPA: c-type cytochrome [Gammaproteobacteria bacterium]|nr:c-type cytochrome [Gammaproteobacteria bacterium]